MYHWYINAPHWANIAAICGPSDIPRWFPQAYHIKHCLMLCIVLWVVYYLIKTIYCIIIVPYKIVRTICYAQHIVNGSNKVQSIIPCSKSSPLAHSYFLFYCHMLMNMHSSNIASWRSPLKFWKPSVTNW